MIDLNKEMEIACKKAWNDAKWESFKYGFMSGLCLSGLLLILLKLLYD